MNCRILFIDLDGTLVRSDNTISEHSISTLKKCREKDIKIVVATGRPRKSSERFINRINADAKILNGGAIALCGDEQVYRSLIPMDVNEDIIVKSSLNPSVRKITTDAVTGYYANYLVSKENDPTWEDFIHGIVTDFTKGFCYEAYTTTIEIFDENFARKLAEEHPVCGTLRFSGGSWYRFANREATKYNAIKAVAEWYGVDLQNTVSFGDDINDLEMIDRCGTGVAMKNAIDIVKAVSNCVTLSNDEDGVAEWLDKNIL